MKVNSFLFSYETKNINFYSHLILIFCLTNIFILSPDIFEIFSNNGLIKENINNDFIYSYNILLSWLTNPLTYFGIPYKFSFLLIITLYVISLVFSILNFNKLIFSITAWFIHIAMINSSYFFSYGADYFITFALFVNIFFSFSNRKLNQLKLQIIHSFIIRFTQIHLCFVYFFAGFGKALGTDWFNGNALWYVLNSFSPKSTETFFYYFIDYPIFLTLLGWITVLIEFMYPILIYFKITRKATLISVIFLHLSIILFMKFYTFGLIMIILNLVAWGDYYFSCKHLYNNKLIKYIRN